MEQKGKIKKVWTKPLIAKNLSLNETLGTSTGSAESAGKSFP